MTKEKILTELVNTICPEVTLIFNHEDDSYYEYVTDIISVDPEPQADDGFLRHLAEVHKCGFAYDYPLILWTILHEVGHYYTLEDVICDDEIETRVLCATVPLEVARDNERIRNMYYNLPSEWEATEWAIDFIAENTAFCKEFCEIYG